MAQLINVKLSRFDGSPWGFRLQGGKDFGTPLVVQKVRLSFVYQFFFFSFSFLFFFVTFLRLTKENVSREKVEHRFECFSSGRVLYIYIYCSDRTSLTDIACDKSVDSSVNCIVFESVTYILFKNVTLYFILFFVSSFCCEKKKKKRKERMEKKEITLRLNVIAVRSVESIKRFIASMICHHRCIACKLALFKPLLLA